MPLKNGCDYKVMQENISKLVREGRKQDQAIAIAIQHAKDQGCDMQSLRAAAEEAVRASDRRRGD